MQKQTVKDVDHKLENRLFRANTESQKTVTEGVFYNINEILLKQSFFGLLQYKKNQF